MSAIVDDAEMPVLGNGVGLKAVDVDERAWSLLTCWMALNWRPFLGVERLHRYYSLHHVVGNTGCGHVCESTRDSTAIIGCFFLFKHNFCVKLDVPREPRRDSSNRRLNEHGIYIRHCQESNSQLFRPKREPIPMLQVYF